MDTNGETTEVELNVNVVDWADKDPTQLELNNLMAVRDTVLSHREARSQVDQRAEELSGTMQGISYWLRGEYAKGYDALKGAHDSPAATYAFAECALYGGTTGIGVSSSGPSVAVEAISAVKSQSPEFTTLLLRAMVADGDFETASKTFEATEGGYAATADGCYFAGRIAEANGEYDDANAHYERALEIDADHELALFRRAYHLDLSSEDEEAIEIYRDLAQRQPPCVNAVLNLGVLYEDADRFEDAAYEYRRVLSAYPNHPRALMFLKDSTASIDMHYDEEQEVRNDKKAQILKIPVSDFELSVRSRNCLAKMNIVTLSDLVMKTEPELLSYKNFGETSLNEIKQIMETKGLRLGMRPEDDLLPVPSRTSRPTPPPAFAIDPSDERLQRSVTELALSVRARKCLSNLNIKSIAELVAYSADDMLSQRNFGVTSLKEIIDQLEVQGLSLRTVDQ